MLSDLFYIINYGFAIVSSIVGSILGLLMVVIIVTHRKCHSFTNLLICNTSVASFLYFMSVIIVSYNALRDDWQSYQPACIFRGYYSLVFCGALCYSYSIQAVSRLFFALLYKYKYLLTWRTHWILIIINWAISIIIPIEPFLQHNGFSFEMESRQCVVAIKIVSISVYVVCVVFIFPLNIVTMIYGLILHRARQSTRRIMPSVITNTAHQPNRKRNLKLMQNMLVQSSIILAGGIFYLILVIWNATLEHSPTESLNLVALNLIPVFTAVMMITLFLTNKEVKQIAFNYIFRPAPMNVPQAVARR